MKNIDKEELLKELADDFCISYQVYVNSGQSDLLEFDDLDKAIEAAKEWQQELRDKALKERRPCHSTVVVDRVIINRMNVRLD